MSARHERVRLRLTALRAIEASQRREQEARCLAVEARLDRLGVRPSWQDPPEYQPDEDGGTFDV